MNKLTLAFLGGALAIATPALAQSNGSDGTGPNVGGSTTVAGGAFSPTTTGGGDAGGGGGGGATGAAASPAVTTAVGAAATSVANALQAGSLTTAGGVQISASAQATVLGVLSGQASAQTTAEVQSALESAGAPASVVAAVMQAINNILGTTTTAMAEGVQLAATGDAAVAAASRQLAARAAPDPVKVARAIEAFNQLVMSSSAEYLANPPEQFLAIHAALTRLASAYQQ